MTGATTFFRHSIVVRVRRRQRDRHGDYVNPPTMHNISGCAMAPRYSTETENGTRNAVIVGFTLYGPTGGNILADDEVEAPLNSGRWYRVQGEAVEWTSPLTGWTPGFEAALERIT